MEDANSDGGDKENQSNSGRKYFRLLKSLDLSGDGAAKVKDVLEKIFNKLAMRVLVETNPAESSDVESWIEELKEVDFLHFVQEDVPIA